MQSTKRSARTKKFYKEKVTISKIATYILIAFCMQFVFYLLLINFVPFYHNVKVTENGRQVEKQEINSLYNEEWTNYRVKTTDGNYQYITGNHTEGNGIKFIYRYNMVLLVITIALVCYYIFVYMEEHESNFIRKSIDFFKKNVGLLLLLIFMVVCFISSCFAFDLFRSFIGCYNLRDGFFSFMFYGSVLVCIILMNVTNLSEDCNITILGHSIEPRKLVTEVFLGVMVFVAAVTIGDYIVLNKYDSIMQDSAVYIRFVDDSDPKIGFSVEPKYRTKVYLDSQMTNSKEIEVARVSKYSVTSSVFNNSNHYGYVLAIAVVVAAVLFVKEKQHIVAKVWYLIAFITLTYMLIINDTFGAYLGVAAGLATLLIYVLLADNVTENPKKYFFEIPSFLIIALIMTYASATIPTEPFAPAGTSEKIVLKNIADFNQSASVYIKALNEAVKKTTKKTDTSDLIDSIKNKINNDIEESKSIEDNNIVVSGESTNTKQSSNADEAGSGRGKLWLGAKEMIESNFKCLFGDTENYYDKEVENPRSTALKRILIGVGSENMIYEYGKINISEGRSHNLIYQLAVTVGIPAMLLYVLAMTCIFLRAMLYIFEMDKYTIMGMCVMVSYLLTALTGNSGFYTSGYFYIFVGFVAIGCINMKKEKELEEGTKIAKKSKDEEKIELKNIEEPKNKEELKTNEEQKNKEEQNNNEELKNKETRDNKEELKNKEGQNKKEGQKNKGKSKKVKSKNNGKEGPIKFK